MTPNTTSRTHSVSLYLEASSDIVLSMIHKCDSLNHKAKRSVCKLCRLSSNKENSYYNISPLTTIVLLLMKSGDVSPNLGLLSERGHTTQNIHVAIVARVSLVAVEPSHVTPATSGHTTNVLECYQTTHTTNSAAAVANLHICAISVHCTHSRLLMTAITQLSSRKATIFCPKS
ncbi:hypothetical protein NP493_1525g00009 [Ridgeia piscesae]|uniref:Uncharacterized protein n=1 Tax=Ridgeia piscesae TaxID=27915 RepID=A0AAD9K0B5_RIDPI|nr:hypothetical protein NP493_1525g00009 [Ridgeia piscesae]